MKAVGCSGRKYLFLNMIIFNLLISLLQNVVVGGVVPVMKMQKK
jgi:hypothetical protein